MLNLMMDVYDQTEWDFFSKPDVMLHHMRRHDELNGVNVIAHFLHINIRYVCRCGYISFCVLIIRFSLFSYGHDEA